jgi:hypothetical protein
MFSDFSIWDEDGKASDASDSFSSWGRFEYIHFISFAYFDWALASSTFVFGVSWASFSWTNWATRS